MAATASVRKVMARRSTDGMTFLGFNRPRSPLFQRLMAALGSESGPLMVNWFIVGHKKFPTITGITTRPKEAAFWEICATGPI